MTQVSNLSGPALDWAVCVAEGNKPVINPVRFGGVSYGMFESELGYAIKRYSTDWAQGGPIIERELIDIASKFICATAEHPNGTWGWQATAINDDDKAFWHDGPTPLIAAMRCYVASKLGESINLPENLQ